MWPIEVSEKCPNSIILISFGLKNFIFLFVYMYKCAILYKVFKKV